MYESVEADFEQFPARVPGAHDILSLDFPLFDAVPGDDLNRQGMHGQLQVSVICFEIFKFLLASSVIMSSPGTQSSGGITPRCATVP